jgi:hypothetical protein
MAERKTYNRGDIAEVILSAAITAKFLDRPAKGNGTPWVVTDKECKDIVRAVLKNGRITRKKNDLYKASADVTRKARKDGKPINYKKIPTIIDTIHYVAQIPMPSWEYMQHNKKNEWSAVQDLFDSAVFFVNRHAALNRVAKRIAFNGIVDEVKVAAQGTEDQKGTKVDIAILLNGKRTKFQLSVKVEGGEQFAQVSGPEFSKLKKVFKEGLGVSLSSHMEKKFDKELESKGFNSERGYDSRKSKHLDEMKGIVKEATRAVYRQAVIQLNRKLKTDKEATMKTIIDFIAEGAAGPEFLPNGEPGERAYIEIAKLARSQAKSARFEQDFYDAIYALDLVAELGPSSNDPRVRIKDKITGDPLVDVRYKTEAVSRKLKGKKTTYHIYPRNLIEAPKDSIMFKVHKL